MPTDDLHRHLDRLERLRKLGVRRGVEHLMAAPGLVVSSQSSVISLQAQMPNPQSPIPDPQPPTLPGAEIHTPFGPAWLSETRYPLAERPDLAEWLQAGRETLAALGRDDALGGLDPAQAVFVDTETTGLMPEAGTYTFLIGVGTYELPGGQSPADARRWQAEGAFVVRQLFMRHPGEERGQLHLLEEAAAGRAGWVSFNGRAFDLPLLQMRFVLAQTPMPLPGAPHLDLLPAARRMWRSSLESCRLGSLEQHVLDVRRSEEDVPGWLIPSIYRDYYQHGVGLDLMARVFYHNLQDIVSMPLLAARLARHFVPGAAAARLAELRPLEQLNLARSYEALGWSDAALTAYRVALAGPLPDEARLDGYRTLGALLRRLERREDAAALWEEWIGGVAGADLTPYIELAKHHEWHTLDLPAARGWAAWALRVAEAWPVGPARNDALADLRHRLARLERKLAVVDRKRQIDSQGAAG